VSPSSSPRPDPIKGIVFKIIATVAFAIVGACVKAHGPHYPLGEIVFCRSLFMLIPVLLFAARDPQGLGILRTKRFPSHLRRAAAGIAGLTTSLAAVLLLPYADATALSFSAPLVLVGLAAPLLGERIGPYRIAAVLIGFCGVLLIVQPHASNSAAHPQALLGVGIGVISAFCVALAQLSVRALREEPALTTVFYFGLILTVASVLTLPFGWVAPRNLGDPLLLMGMGIIGGIGQLSLTQSYRYADASSLAPYDYLQLIWAVMIGYLAFGETPLPIVLLGALIVAGSGIFVALRERALLKRGVKLEEHTAPPTI
jgi:drug/metabolite transporter (DMT)-like permease